MSEFLGTCDHSKNLHPKMAVCSNWVSSEVDLSFYRGGVAALMDRQRQLFEDMDYLIAHPYTCDRIEIDSEGVSYWQPTHRAGWKAILPIQLEALHWAFRLNDPSKHQLTAYQLFATL